MKYRKQTYNKLKKKIEDFTDILICGYVYIWHVGDDMRNTETMIDEKWIRELQIPVCKLTQCYQHIQTNIPPDRVDVTKFLNEIIGHQNAQNTRYFI